MEIFRVPRSEENAQKTPIFPIHLERNYIFVFPKLLLFGNLLLDKESKYYKNAP